LLEFVKMSKAFTLLELLVVITIIGILSSIVIVSMSGSTDSADIAKNKSFAQQVHALLGHETVLDLNFNENAYGSCPDGKDVCDASGYNNNGDISNNEAAYVLSSIDGYALSFNGSSDYINCGKNLSLDLEGGSKGTVGLWVKAISWPEEGEYPSIITKGNSGGWAAGSYHISLWSGSIHFVLSAHKLGPPYYITIDYSYFDLDTWHYLLMTWNGTIFKAYIDGNSINNGVTQTVNAVQGEDQDLYIGRSNSYYFNGLVDEFSIYSEALSATQIKKYYIQGLKNLLVKQSITQTEYDQRMEEFNKSLVSYEE